MRDRHRYYVVPCPYCRASIGKPCRSRWTDDSRRPKDYGVPTEPHRGRVRLAEQSKPPDPTPGSEE